MDIGEKISILRKRLGMTLEELGEKVGVGKSTVRKWENGMISNMRRDKIAKIAEALSVSPAYLMGWTDNPEANEVQLGRIVNIEHAELHVSSELVISDPEEIEVLKAYRAADDNMKKAIKTILGVKDEENG